MSTVLSVYLALTSCSFLHSFLPYICYPMRARSCEDMSVVIRRTMIPIGSSLTTGSPRICNYNPNTPMMYTVLAQFNNNIIDKHHACWLPDLGTSLISSIIWMAQHSWEPFNLLTDCATLDHEISNYQVSYWLWVCPG